MGTHIQFSSVTQLYPTLCEPMNSSTPGLPVHHQLPESTHTRVHRVSDAIQPSHPLLSPSPPALNLSQHQFSSVQFIHSIVSDSLQPHEPQHARPPCPSPTPDIFRRIIVLQCCGGFSHTTTWINHKYTLWPPDVKSRLIGKEPNAGKEWGQEEKGVAEDEMVG